MSNSNHKK